MATNQGNAALRTLMKRAGFNFHTRRVLQRWYRGEISTDVAVELLQPDDARRLVGTWRDSQSSK